MAVDYVTKIEALARPFVESGLYSSAEEFFRDVVASLDEKRIKTYERAIKRFESKYNSLLRRIKNFPQLTMKSFNKIFMMFLILTHPSNLYTT
jgi:hypothetical protein